MPNSSEDPPTENNDERRENFVARILLIGPLPPPVHGQSLTGQLIIDELTRRDHTVDGWHIMGAADTNDIGVARGKKAVRLVGQLPRKLLEIRRWGPTHVISTIGIADSSAVALRDCLVPRLVKLVTGAHTIGYLNGLASPELIASNQRRKFVAKLLGLFDTLVEPYSGSTNSIDVDLETVVIPFSADVPAKIESDTLVFDRPRGSGAPFGDARTGNILYLSNLYPEKGAGVVVRAIAELRERGHDVSLIVGGGDTPEQTAAELRSLATDLGVADAVRIVGPVPASERWTYFANADVFCLPTSYRAEMLPISLIESLASGAAIVATEWRGIGPTFSDCPVAFLVEADPSSVASAIEDALSVETKEREALARSFFDERLSPKIFGDRIEALFHQHDTAHTQPST